MVSSSPTPHFAQRRDVEFHETDAAGLVHFTNLLRWMEAAELAFLRDRGVPVLDSAKHSGWPRAAASAQFLAPLQFGDEVETRLWVRKIGACCVNYGFEIWRLRPTRSPELAATGEISTVYVSRARGKLRPIRLPAAIRNKLK